MTFGARGARLRVHSDIVAGGAIIAFCAIVYAATYGFDTVPLAIAQGMGPEAFPRLVLLTIMALAVLMIWQARFRADAARDRVPPMVPYTGIAAIAYMPAAELLGMLPASFVFLVAVGRMWGARSWPTLVIAAAAMCVSLWAVFVRGFGVLLHAGMLESALY
jgi:hypothetical protein